MNKNVHKVPKKRPTYRCASNCYFTIHDFQGRCLLSRAPSDHEQIIDLGELPDGKYILTISGKNEMQTRVIDI